MYAIQFSCGPVLLVFEEFRFFKSLVSTITTVPSLDRSRARHGKD